MHYNDHGLFGEGAIPPVSEPEPFPTRVERVVCWARRWERRLWRWQLRAETRFDAFNDAYGHIAFIAGFIAVVAVCWLIARHR